MVIQSFSMKENVDDSWEAAKFLRRDVDDVKTWMRVKQASWLLFVLCSRKSKTLRNPIKSIHKKENEKIKKKMNKNKLNLMTQKNVSINHIEWILHSTAPATKKSTPIQNRNTVKFPFYSILIVFQVGVLLKGNCN